MLFLYWFEIDLIKTYKIYKVQLEIPFKQNDKKYEKKNKNDFNNSRVYIKASPKQTHSKKKDNYLYEKKKETKNKFIALLLKLK